MKRFKKMVSILLTFAMISGFTVISPKEAKAGDSASNEYFEYDYGGANSEATITKYIGSDERIYIPEEIDGHKVTEIADQAFSGVDFKKIIIPKTIEVIGESIFGDNDCSEILICYGSTISDWEAISENIYNSYYIDECDMVYNYGGVLSYRKIEEKIRIYDTNDSVKTLNIPETIEYLPVTGIDYMALAGCLNVKECYLPDSLEFIGYGAFDSSKIEKIYIGSGVKIIRGSVFNNMNYLTDIYYNGYKNEWNKIYIESAKNTVLNSVKMHYAETVNMVTIYNLGAPVDGEEPRANIKTSANCVFEGVKWINMTDDPDGNQNGNPFEVGKKYRAKIFIKAARQFKFGTTISDEVEIPNISVTVNNGYATGKAVLLMDTDPKEKACIFVDFVCKAAPDYSDTKTTEDFIYRINEDSGVVEIVKYIGTTTVANIPEEIDDYPVTSINDETFTETEVKNVYIPETVVYIGDSAFEYANKIVSVKYASTKENFDKIDIGGYNDILEDESKVVYNEGHELSYQIINNEVHIYGTNEESEILYVPEYIEGYPVKIILSYAFSDCHEINEYHLPDTLKIIGYAAFEGSNFEKLYIGSGVKSISEDAFCLVNDLKYVYYNGTEEEWNEIEIAEDGNTVLNNIEIDFVDYLDHISFYIDDLIDGYGFPCSCSANNDGTVDICDIEWYSLEDGMITDRDQKVEYGKTYYCKVYVKAEFGYRFNYDFDSNKYITSTRIIGYTNMEPEAAENPEKEIVIIASRTCDKTEPDATDDPGYQKETEEPSESGEPKASDSPEETSEPGASILPTVSGSPETTSSPSTSIDPQNSALPSVSPDTSASPSASSDSKTSSEKKKQSVTVKVKTKKVKASKLKKKAQKVKKAIVVKNSVGTLTYTRVKKGSNKYLTINKKGIITVKKYKKAQKGRTLKIKVKLKAAGDEYYKAYTKTVTVKIKLT
ncbi:MAG: leucine-rich repeat protein [Lachnospiraceae bacterium]|nr:leucine-rich repeat protein [Lachnospiraceae bacterium]